jgi:alkyl hydroperoxide reductase subunit AhpC
VPLTIGDTAPDFTAQTTLGEIRFHDWIGDDWAVLFSHPRAFTPVCTTELGHLAAIRPEFDRRGVRILAISTDPVYGSVRWTRDIAAVGGAEVDYPIVADTDHAVSAAYGMLPGGFSGDPTERTPAQNATLRNVFVIAPDKTIALVLVYPMSTGRNFDEILRALDALQLTAAQQLSTPAQWRPGDDAILSGAVSDEQARERYPGGWRQPLPYLRVVPTA